MKNTEEQISKQRDKKMYVTYKNVGSIYSVLQRNKPVSCVKMFSAGYYVMVKNVSTNKVEGFPISFQYKKIDTLAMVYHSVVIDMSKTEEELCKVDTTAISSYVLLLPELGEYGYTKIDTLSLYYIIVSEWKELDQNM